MYQTSNEREIACLLSVQLLYGLFGMYLVRAFKKTITAYVALLVKLNGQPAVKVKMYGKFLLTKIWNSTSELAQVFDSEPFVLYCTL